jgi:hypothetical protein
MANQNNEFKPGNQFNISENPPYDIKQETSDMLEEAHLWNNGEIEGEELTGTDKAKEAMKVMSYHLEQATLYQRYLQNIIKNDIEEDY